MNVLLKFYFAWFKIGMFTFGGGYAMLPLIQKEVIDKHHWATEEEILDYYADIIFNPSSRNPKNEEKMFSDFIEEYNKV